MGLEIEYLPGQTPLEPEEVEGLLIDSIATREELDEFEQQNIEEAMEWMMTRSFKKEQVLTEKFICDLHKRMYGKVWAWAGEFRNTEKNIGIKKWEIAPALKVLLEDTLFWIQNNTYQPDEIALRFKHRIVSIHCFPNGNGRHSRLIADLIISKLLDGELFSWGAANLVSAGESRTLYLQAVKAADGADYEPLLAFARS